MRSQFLVTLAAGTAALALSSPAFAQSTEEAPFSGVYVGGSIGFDAQPNDVGSGISFDRNLDGTFGDAVTSGAGTNAFANGFCNGRATSTANTSCANDKDGLSYAARVGIDQQIGHIVFGVVGEFGKSEIRDSVSGFSSTPAAYTFTRKLKYDASIRGRLGYAANNTLFYAAGGPGYAKLRHSFTTTNALNAFSSDGDSDTWGFVAGGGIEQKIGRNFSVGLEYLYNQYKDDDYTVRAARGTAAIDNPFISAPNTTGTDLTRSDQQFRWHSVRATAAFRF
ncbi:outer membrane protein [Sphingomonas endolithica]|uniref:outer membrane protein n=1 Tax=Sphingomonas endolithica TaxID=2972485 RepID=UPI0021AE851A|nr:outer membrane beta-barrel protein [Sphingomonas sp. ZFBP2030]